MADDHGVGEPAGVLVLRIARRHRRHALAQRDVRPDRHPVGVAVGADGDVGRGSGAPAAARARRPGGAARAGLPLRPARRHPRGRAIAALGISASMPPGWDVAEERLRRLAVLQLADQLRRLRRRAGGRRLRRRHPLGRLADTGGRHRGGRVGVASRCQPRLATQPYSRVLRRGPSSSSASSPTSPVYRRRCPRCCGCPTSPVGTAPRWRRCSTGSSARRLGARRSCGPPVWSGARSERRPWWARLLEGRRPERRDRRRCPTPCSKRPKDGPPSPAGTTPRSWRGPTSASSVGCPMPAVTASGSTSSPAHGRGAALAACWRRRRRLPGHGGNGAVVLQVYDALLHRLPSARRDRRLGRDRAGRPPATVVGSDEYR